MDHSRLMDQSRPQSSASNFVLSELEWNDFSDTRRDPPKSDCIYRIGPAPREDVSGGTESSPIGTLDSDLEEGFTSKKSKKAAASRALIIYFAKMARKGSTERIDYRFLDSLFKGGANVNVTDKHGQTVLHEVARNWNTDLAKYFLGRGADINKGDNWARTPLHLSSAVNHVEMVEFLINNGAHVHAKTNGELQSPIHYAAKYNAVGSLKILLQLKAKMNDRDYKQRTPLFIAAEMAREEAARYLVDYGVPVGTFDDTGMSTIAHMVEKMPHIAVDALDQFMVDDTAFRKSFFYLNYMEYDPIRYREESQTHDEFGVPLVVDKKEAKKRKRKKQDQCTTTPLKLAVQLEEFDIIMHPVMQRLIKEKWNKFGRFGAIIAASIHLIYIMIWTMLAIFIPRDGNYYGGSEKYWRIPLELMGVLMTLYFILTQIWDRKIKFKDQKTFRLWRTRQLNRDMDFCHPRWSQEKTFLESEMKAVRTRKQGLLSDPWNVFDFLTYAAVSTVIVTRLASFFIKKDAPSDEIHLKAYTATLIFMWLHFMKSCRPFTTLGPFITMLGHVMKDTITFAFLFVEFFVPYTVSFWILFGGTHNAMTVVKHNEANPGDEVDTVDWEEFHNTVFSVWQVMLNVDFNWDALVVVDRLMAQVLVGTFFAFATVLCLNLYIALLSETFNRVYQNATANASLLQANTILQLESILSKKKKAVVFKHIQEECGPLVAPQAEDPAGVTDEELWDKVIRSVHLRFDQLADYVKSTANPKSDCEIEHMKKVRKYEQDKEMFDVYQILMQRDKELHQMRLDIFELKRMFLEYYGHPEMIGNRPHYKPPPKCSIQMPTPVPKYQPPAPQPKQNPLPPSSSRPGSSGVGQHPQNDSFSKRRNNEIFRSIMESKSQEGLNVLADGDDPNLDDDFDLSGSWENIPPTEFSCGSDGGSGGGGSGGGGS
eukprot:TCONS_00034914-protein